MKAGGLIRRGLKPREGILGQEIKVRVSNFFCDIYGLFKINLYHFVFFALNKSTPEHKQIRSDMKEFETYRTASIFLNFSEEEFRGIGVEDDDNISAGVDVDANAGPSRPVLVDTADV